MSPSDTQRFLITKRVITWFLLFDCRGMDAEELDALFRLIERIGEICEGHIESNTDPIGGKAVGGLLRYRLLRMIVGDTFDDRSDLKLRFLKLIFNFAVQETRSGRSIQYYDQTSGSMSRTRSFGLVRTRSGRDTTLESQLTWTAALDEVGKMQGQKMLPLVKSLLLENAKLSLKCDAFPLQSRDEEAKEEKRDSVLEGSKLLDDCGERKSILFEKGANNDVEDPFTNLATTRISGGRNKEYSRNSMESFESGFEQQLSISSENVRSVDHTASHSWRVAQPESTSSSGLQGSIVKDSAFPYSSQPPIVKERSDIEPTKDIETNMRPQKFAINFD